MFLIRNQIIRTMTVFTQKLNPLSGLSEWEVLDEEYDFHQEIARSAFADMLHDTERNQKYYKALKKAIDAMHTAGKKANVLDIGTGTGLLSMMAARCGADTITACEAFNPMARCALKIIKANGFAEKIKLIPKCSLDVEIGRDMAQKANILVTEVFDTELIGEGAISTFSHAHRELLEDDCIVVPTSAKIYAQVVESSLARNWSSVNPINDKSNDLTLLVPDDIKSCMGSPAVHDIQLSQFPLDAFKTIVSPTQVFHFDWSGKTPLVCERNSLVKQKAERSGKAQAVFVWWDLQMDVEGDIILSCAPYWAHPDTQTLKENTSIPIKDVLPWRDHWMQAVYFLPEEHSVHENDPITLSSNHDEYSLWFNVNPTQNNHSKPICACLLHSALSRTRLGQLNDEKRTLKYISALKGVVTPKTNCLCLSDGSLLGLFAAKLGAHKVTCVQTGNICQTLLRLFTVRNDLCDRISFADKIPGGLSDIDLVIGEPFFLYSLLPWDNFYFMYVIKNKLKGMLSTDVKFLPRRAQIKVMAVDFLNLNKIKSNLNTCEGFEMDIFDRLIKHSSDKSDAKVEPQPLWEYTGLAQSKPQTIFTIDIASNIQIQSETVTELNFDSPGSINGLALWVDWFLDDSSEYVVSSGPTEEVCIGREIKWDMHVRQGVHLLQKPLKIDAGESLQCSVMCSEVIDKVSFMFKYNEKVCK